MHKHERLAPGTIRLRVRQAISRPNRQYFTRKVTAGTVKTPGLTLVSDSTLALSATANTSKTRRDADSSLVSLPKIGEILVGHYQFVSLIGKGGMGVIYKCKHPILDKFVAIKMLRQRDLADEAIRRFQVEARAASLLNHPNLISVHDFGVTPEGNPYMVMDFIEGKTLAEAIASGQQFSIQQVIQIFVQCCEGLIEAHKNNVLHRDIKSSNIILTLSEFNALKVKIVDFGIAKIIRHDERETLQLTKTGDVFGSPLYMSPEQGGGNRRVDHRTDIYSLGCVLFETLTGAPPFLGTTAIETLLKHMTEEPPTLKDASLGREFPPQLENLVKKMLAKDPAERPSSMLEVRDELQKVSAALSESRGQSPLSDAIKTRAQTLKSRSIPWEMLAIAGLIGVLVLSCIFAVLKLITAEPVKKEAAPAPIVDPLSNSLAIPESAEEEGWLRQIRDKINQAARNGTDQVVLKEIPLSRKQFELLSQANWVHDLTLLRCENVNADGLRYLKRLPLTRLSIVDSDINDEGLEEVAEFKNLTFLDITRTRNTSWNGLKKLGQLTKLRNLFIVNAQCSNEALEHLLGLRELRELDVSDNPLIQDSSVELISRIPLLAALHLRNTSISNKGSQYLPRIADLHYLDLSGNKQISDASMTYIAKVMRLETLAINGTSVTGNGLLKLKGKRSLKGLQAKGVGRVTRSQWRELVASLGPRVNYSEPNQE